MPSEAVNGTLELLLPGVTTSGQASEAVVTAMHPGFLREVRTLPGATLHRDYDLGPNRTRMIAASLDVYGLDIGPGLGDPEYQQYSAGSGIAIGVLEPISPIRRIYIIAEEPLLAHNEQAPPIDSAAAERLLEEILPQPLATEITHIGRFVSGGYHREQQRRGQIFLSRGFVNDVLVNIFAHW